MFNLDTKQMVYFGALAASLLGGGAYAYKFGAGELARLVQDNKMVFGGLVAVGTYPLWSPWVAKGYEQLPSFAKVPMSGIHMNGIAMGALAMQKNPLMVRRNPIAMGAIHAMNGLHI